MVSHSMIINKSTLKIIELQIIDEIHKNNKSTLQIIELQIIDKTHVENYTW